MIDENLFKRKRMNIDKILQYGFIFSNGLYTYQKEIMNGDFILFVDIDKFGIVSTRIIEKAFNEEYTLYKVESASGAFVGQIRLEVEEVLKDIVNHCYDNSIYKYPQSDEVIKYIRDRYNTELEFLWEKYPEFGVMRNKENNKWYGLLSSINKDKLIKRAKGEIEVVNLRIQIDKESPVDYHSIFPAYHMNKKSWVTVILDDSLPIEKIYEMIDISYQLSKKAK